MSGLIQLSNSAARWLKIGSKRGVSAIEYGLLAALISLVMVGGVVKVGTNLGGVFQSIAATLPTAGDHSAGPLH